MYIKYILILLILLIAVSASGFKVEDWMRGEGSNSGMSSCENTCEENYNFCRNIASENSFRGAGAWAEDMKECKKQYKNCLYFCIKND